MKTSYFRIIQLTLTVCLLGSTSCNEIMDPGEESSISEVLDYSDITCPKCGHIETEKLPTEVCQLKYECKNCGHDMTPEGDDCCVFCTHGTHKCPSMQ